MLQFVGSPCGQHGPYTFYKSFKYLRNGKYKQLSLGEFFFVQISEDVPLGIGELQLLWEDKNADCTHLTSVRLYFLPEHTSEGKQEYHGEDEVLAENNKVVMRVEDLLDWIVEDASWTYGMTALTTTIPPPLKAEHGGNHVLNHDHANHCLPNHANSNLRNSKCARPGKDVSNNHNKCSTNKHDKGTNGLSNDVVVLSYSQYCRYRAMLKRLENVTDKWLRNVLVCALGGFTVTEPNTRILFCRDTTEHPLLEDHDCRLDHLAPNLKGRPRKKKLKFKRETSVESDSNESEGGASDKMTPEKERPMNNIMKNPCNLLSSKKKEMITLNEKKFMSAINDYMNKRGTPIGRIPSLGFKQLDLYQMYLISQRLGGYEQITQKRLWKIIYDKLGGNPGSTSAATCTRRHYEKLLLPFERYMKNELHKPFPKPYVRVRGKTRNGNDSDGKSINGEPRDDDISDESSSNDVKPPPPLTPVSSQNGSVPSSGDAVKPPSTSASYVPADITDKENALMNLSSISSIRCPVESELALPPGLAALATRNDGFPRPSMGLPLPPPLRHGFPPELLTGLARLPVSHAVPGKVLAPPPHSAGLPPSSVANLSRSQHDWVGNSGRASVIQHTPPGGSNTKLLETPGGNKPPASQPMGSPYLLPGQYPPLPPKLGSKRPYPFDRTPPPAHSHRTPTAQLLRDFDPKRPHLVMEVGSILDQHMRRMQRLGQGKEDLPTDLSRRPTLAIPRPPHPMALTSHPLSLVPRADAPSRLGGPHLRHLTPPRIPLPSHIPQASPSSHASSAHSSPRAPPPAAHGHGSYPSPSTQRSVSSSSAVDHRRTSPLVGALASGLSPHLLSPVLGLFPRAMASAVSPHNLPKPSLPSPSSRTDKLSPHASERSAVPASISPGLRAGSDTPTYIPALTNTLGAAKEKDSDSTASSATSVPMALTSSSTSFASIQAAAAAAGAAGRMLPVSLPDGQIILHPAFPQFASVLPGGVIPSQVDPRLLFDAQSMGSSGSSGSSSAPSSKDNRDGSAATTAAVTLSYTPSLYLSRK